VPDPTPASGLPTTKLVTHVRASSSGGLLNYGKINEPLILSSRKKSPSQTQRTRIESGGASFLDSPQITKIPQPDQNPEPKLRPTKRRLKLLPKTKVLTSDRERKHTPKRKSEKKLKSLILSSRKGLPQASQPQLTGMAKLVNELANANPGEKGLPTLRQEARRNNLALAPVLAEFGEDIHSPEVTDFLLQCWDCEAELSKLEQGRSSTSELKAKLEKLLDRDLDQVNLSNDDTDKAKLGELRELLKPNAVDTVRDTKDIEAENSDSESSDSESMDLKTIAQIKTLLNELSFETSNFLSIRWNNYLPKAQKKVLAKAELNWKEAKKEAKEGVKKTIKRLVRDENNRTMLKVFNAASAIPDSAYRDKVVEGLKQQFKATVPNDVQIEVDFWLQCWEVFTQLNGELASLNNETLTTTIDKLLGLKNPLRTEYANLTGVDDERINKVADNLDKLKNLMAEKNLDAAAAMRYEMRDNLRLVMETLQRSMDTVGQKWDLYVLPLKQKKQT
jgi:hypothetical protein